jgi:colanic acid/amylovoran biosynthesis glycosyltransferase
MISPVPKPPPVPAERELRPQVALFRSPMFNASETFVRAHAEGLARYRPLLVGLELKGDARCLTSDRLLVPATAGGRLAIRVLGRWGELGARVAEQSPVLVHAHFATDGLLALSLAQRLRVPLVTTLHGYDVALSRPRLLLSGRLSWMRYALLGHKVARQGALFLAVSDAVRDRAIARGFPEKRIRTHYLGVDLDRLGPDPQARQLGLILHVGRLVEKKGTFILLEALARLSTVRPDARLVVIGDGPERRALERRTIELGLAGTILFTGTQPPDAVAAWMRKASVLAAPSVTARDGDAEGLPTVIVEAAASALPAVGSDHAGIPEAILEGRSGFIVPERDAEALAARLGQVLDDPQRQERMGMEARRLAEQRFDASRQMSRLEDIYDGLVGQIRA